MRRATIMHPALIRLASCVWRLKTLSRSCVSRLVRTSRGKLSFVFSRSTPRL